MREPRAPRDCVAASAIGRIRQIPVGWEAFTLKWVGGCSAGEPFKVAGNAASAKFYATKATQLANQMD